ncbi:TonB-dependent receptor [Erythrobacter arachoides]|uniref:TonB-dependent receptor n=2 Tax=Aurantiacibacter arachoides TaxID=1850444 RepID=A0A844ZZL6_9SPHN|nr:TonB-dependent receptor [Aurantiacibacter arachoides]
MIAKLLGSACAAAICLTLVPAAAAQDVPPEQQDNDRDADFSGAIIVTAQRREESLQDTAIAVTALGGDRLQNQQVTTLQDLQVAVPAVTFGNDFNMAKVFIRGVGANTSTTGSSTGVALHVDGVYVARAEAQLTSLFDLERVEVLRGPQGTLYGRNAVGGSINLITARPTDYFTGYVRGTYGNYNRFIGEAAIGGPIVDGVRFRVAGMSQQGDGFGENPVTGQDVDDMNRWMGRAHLEVDLGATGELLLTGEYFRQNDSAGAVHYLAPSFPGVPRLAPLGVGGYAVEPRDLASEIQPGTDTESYAFTGHLSFDISDSISIANIASYRDFQSKLYQDLDLSGVVNGFTVNGRPSTVQRRTIDAEQFSNELQLTYSSDLVDGVLGGFYFHEVQHPIDSLGLGRETGVPTNTAILARDNVPLDRAYFLCGFQPDGTTGGNTLQTPKRVCTRSNLTTDAWAVFGQATFDVGQLVSGLDGFSVRLGGRFSHEKVISENPGIVIRYAAGAPNNALPTLVATEEGTHTERTFEDFSPEFGLQYRPNPDLLLYYTYSEGFKAGSGENAFASTTIVDPEYISNHEVGVKYTFMDGRLNASLTGFSYDLEGLQLNKTISGGPTGYTTVFDNAADSSASGIEFELFGSPFDGFRFSSAVSYTDASFGDYVTIDPFRPANVAGGTPFNAVTNPDPTAFGAPCDSPDDLATTPTCEINLAGNALRNTPEWSVNTHLEYDLPFELGSGGIVTAQTDVSYRSQIYFTEFEREIEGSDPYALVDAALRYESGDGDFTASLWVRNLFDTDRKSSTFALATGRLIGATYLPPRTFGVTAGYEF